MVRRFEVRQQPPVPSKPAPRPLAAAGKAGGPAPTREAASEESFDFHRFVDLYNEQADRSGGHHFEPDLSKSHLESLYQSGKYSSLKEFARARFINDQIVS